MTLVTIDLGDVAGGHDPDDHVIIRAEAFRESPGGGVTSTAEVKIPLVDGVGQAEVEPGPVVIAFRCRAVADTREKRGVVPASGTVGIEKVLENAFEYLPPVVNHALETIKGAVAAEVGAIRWIRDRLTSESDLNTLQHGVYPFQAGVVSGMPTTGAGSIWVYPTAFAFTAQEVLGTDGGRWYRRSTATGWTDWQPIDAQSLIDASMSGVDAKITNAKFVQGLLPEGTDLATTNISGVYGISTANRNTILDLPPTSQPAVGVITLVRIGNTKYQQMAVHGGTPELWHRSSQSIGAMQPWRNLLAVEDDAPEGITFGFGSPNEMRLQAFREAYPLVSTGGKGAVVFRYDHGLTNFKNVLLPLHQARGIPAYIAMNSRLWDLSENSGATQAEAKSWLASGLVEFGNHTAHHENVDSIDALFDTIVNGRKELEAQLGATIHGFTMPGIGGDGVWDVGVGNLNTFSDSIAGSLILANHAITSGFLNGPFRVMDGVIRQGGRHFTWERASFADIKAQIDQAIVTKTALTLMCHPRTMESTSGGHTYWDAALATQVLDYVKAKIDAGELANISYYQSHHAQLGSLPVPTYTSGLRDISSELINGWSGTLFVEREGKNVYFRGQLTGATATSDIAWMLPAGFRPGFIQSGAGATDYGSGIAWSHNNPPRVYRINHYLNRLQLVGAQGETSPISVNHTIRTPDGPPSSVPGVRVG